MNCRHIAPKSHLTHKGLRDYVCVWDTSTHKMASAVPISGDLNNSSNKQINSHNQYGTNYGVHLLFNNVLETIFSALPTDEKTRKKEQERRRQFKEKLKADHYNKLIIDSSYVNNEGKDQKEYTNTLLVTDNLKFWEDKIVEKLCVDYIRGDKDLKNGYQIFFKNKEGIKYLSFSFYPGKDKLMVQGSHDDLADWITMFRDMSKIFEQSAPPSSNHVDASQVTPELTTGDSVIAAGSEKGVVKNLHSPHPAVPPQHGTEPVVGGDAAEDLGKPENSTEQEETPKVSEGLSLSAEINDSISDSIVVAAADGLIDVQSAIHPPSCLGIPENTPVNSCMSSTSTSVEDSADVEHPVAGAQKDNEDGDMHEDDEETPEDNDSLLFHSFDDNNNIDMDKEPKRNVLKDSVKTYSKSCRPKKRVSIGVKRILKSPAAATSLWLKQRLDSVEAIVCGLQAGVMQIVDNIASYKELAEDNFQKLHQAAEKNVGQAPSQCKCDKETKTLKESVDRLKAAVEKVSTTVKDTQRKENTQCRDSHTNLKTVVNTVREETSRSLTGIQRNLHRLEEVVDEVKITNSIINDNVLKVLKFKGSGEKNHTEGTVQSRDDRSHGTVKPLATSDNPVGADETDFNYVNRNKKGVNRTQPTREEPHRPARPPGRQDSSSQEVNRDKKNERKVLLMGDSTTKLIDKRRLLKQETVSKCQTGTISAAHERMASGSSTDMEKVIFCVGLNDLRNGSDPKQVEFEMKHLVDETIYRHPKCYIYICSILPVDIQTVSKATITNTNTRLQNLEKYHEKIFFIDISRDFVNDRTPWSLFNQDRIHPNVRGTSVMINSIRRKFELHSRKHSLRCFVNKPATPHSVSYADSLTRASASDTHVQETRKRK